MAKLTIDGLVALVTRTVAQEMRIRVARIELQSSDPKSVLAQNMVAGIACCVASNYGIDLVDCAHALGIGPAQLGMISAAIYTRRQEEPKIDALYNRILGIVNQVKEVLYE